MSQNNRTERIYIRVSAKEKEAIEAKAEAAQASSLATYIREMAINGKVINTSTPEMRELIANLYRIGSNLNQIARKANTFDKLSAEDDESVKDYQKQLCELEKEILKRIKGMCGEK